MIEILIVNSAIHGEMDNRTIINDRYRRFIIKLRYNLYLKIQFLLC